MGASCLEGANDLGFVASLLDKRLRQIVDIICRGSAGEANPCPARSC